MKTRKKGKSTRARARRRGPPRGKVPPQLRPYLFKKGRTARRRRRANPRKKGRTERTTTRTVVTRVRKTNPRRHRKLFAMVARAPGRKDLRFTGTKFSDHGQARLFRSLAELRTAAKGLRRRYGSVLSRYGLYAEPRRVK